MEIIKHHLPDNQYIKKAHPKKAIFLHHTAGGHRPDWTIDAWAQTPEKTSTAYMIGGISTRDKGDTVWDGKILEAFEDQYVGGHLGITAGFSPTHNAGDWEVARHSIGIEVCNYGYVSPDGGRYFNWVNSVIPEDMVVDLGYRYRTMRYWHRYTDAQLESLRKLLLHIADKHGIDLKRGLQECFAIRESEVINMPEGLGPKNAFDTQAWLNRHGITDHNGNRLTQDGLWGACTKAAFDKANNSPFELQTAAAMGQPGLWVHGNVRSDKADMFPQQELIDMIKSF